MKLPHRRTHSVDSEAQQAAEFAVDHVCFADEPLWYLRLTSHARLTWRRELAAVVSMFAAGIALGFLLGRR